MDVIVRVPFVLRMDCLRIQNKMSGIVHDFRFIFSWKLYIWIVKNSVLFVSLILKILFSDM